jgi:uncharacterized protein YbbC (DUF1343 family)
LRLALAVGLFLITSSAHARRHDVLTGIDVLSEGHFYDFQGKKLALITAPGAVDKRDKAVSAILSSIDGVTLTNALLHPTTQTLDLTGVDILIWDVPLTGLRLSPEIASLTKALKDAAAAKIPLIVLDRPNPLGGVIMEGPIVDDPILPTPLRHGMTAGELATLANETVQHPGLQVVKMKGWKRADSQRHLDAWILRPGVSLVAATNLSIGQGTPLLYRWIGAPWLDAKKVLSMVKAEKFPGISLKLRELTPTSDPYEGVPCRGIKIEVDDASARATEVVPFLLQAVRQRHPGQLTWDWAKAKELLGNDGFRKLYEKKVAPAEMVKVFRRGPAVFAETRKPHLLY